MRTGLAPENAVGLGLLARWALASRDGDMIGGDLPAWLLDLLGRSRITPPGRPARRVHLFGLRALPQMLRRAHHPPRPPGRHRDRQPCAGDDPGGDGRPRRRHAPAALRVRRGPSPVRCRRRRVRRASERRRGLRPEALAAGRGGRRGSRARGLERRLNDLLGDDAEAQARCAACSIWRSRLPSPNWQTRLVDGTVLGPAEEFLAAGAPAGAGAGAPARTRASARNATCARSIPA